MQVKEHLMMKHEIFFIILFSLLLLPLSSAAAAGTPIDMVYVPAGYSMMGAENGDLTAESDAKPYHLVYVDAFYMDKQEVTNADYAVCVNAGACRSPESIASKTRSDYYTNPMYASFPVVNVSWQDAVDYCQFVEKRLPTEAEWERAARGLEDNRRYPWGNGTPKAVNMNVSAVPGDTERVNIYSSGLSPYGAADMLGNAAEWVSDWYDPLWYEQKEQENPQGPLSGYEKVIRGGSFQTDLSSLHAANREGLDPHSYAYDVGFRCAMSIRVSVQYNTATNDEDTANVDFAYVKAGNENGIFLLAEPGSGYGTSLICVVPNGAVVEILAGPVNINYSDWYQIRTQNGESGWTIASAVVNIE